MDKTKLLAMKSDPNFVKARGQFIPALMTYLMVRDKAGKYAAKFKDPEFFDAIISNKNGDYCGMKGQLYYIPIAVLESKLLDVLHYEYPKSISNQISIEEEVKEDKPKAYDKSSGDYLLVEMVECIIQTGYQMPMTISQIKKAADLMNEDWKELAERISDAQLANHKAKLVKNTSILDKLHEEERAKVIEEFGKKEKPSLPPVKTIPQLGKKEQQCPNPPIDNTKPMSWTEIPLSMEAMKIPSSTLIFKDNAYFLSQKDVDIYDNSDEAQFYYEYRVAFDTNIELHKVTSFSKLCITIMKNIAKHLNINVSSPHYNKEVQKFLYDHIPIGKGDYDSAKYGHNKGLYGRPFDLLLMQYGIGKKPTWGSPFKLIESAVDNNYFIGNMKNGNIYMNIEVTKLVFESCKKVFDIIHPNSIVKLLLEE